MRDNRDRLMLQTKKFQEENSISTYYVKFYDHKQSFFRVILPPKIHEISRFSRTLLGWLTASHLALIYPACYVLLETCGNFS